MAVTVKTTVLHESQSGRGDAVTQLRLVEVADKQWVDLRDFLPSSNRTGRGYLLPYDADELETLAAALIEYVRTERRRVMAG